MKLNKLTIMLGAAVMANAAFANQSVRLTFSLSSSFQNMWNWKKIDKTTL